LLWIPLTALFLHRRSSANITNLSSVFIHMHDVYVCHNMHVPCSPIQSNTGRSQVRFPMRALYFFIVPHPSSRTDPEFTEPLTEMSTWRYIWG
jgi:hypothetical protein